MPRPASPAGPGAVDRTYDTEKVRLRVTTLAAGLSHPWGLAFLPDGRMLVTERAGRMVIVSTDGAISAPVEGVPTVYAEGQGGLLDVALHPGFAANGLVYFSFSEAGRGGSGTAVGRGRLEDGAAPRLSGVEIIFRQQPKVESDAHFGSRLVFDRQGKLWVTLGERFAGRFRVRAQTLDNHFGKVVRLDEDGSAPADNPFVGRAGALPEIWSYGHRNAQGAALHPGTGEVWIHEHGPRGGDEINIPVPGGNYGWPVVSYGVNYDGTPVGTGAASAPGIVEPIHVWTPSIGPSGMAFHQGGAFPAWQGNLFVGALALSKLVRLELDGRTVVHEEDLLADLALRIRDVRTGPDGALTLLTDDDEAEILRLSPA